MDTERVPNHLHQQLERWFNELDRVETISQQADTLDNNPAAFPGRPVIPDSKHAALSLPTHGGALEWGGQGQSRALEAALEHHPRLRAAIERHRPLIERHDRIQKLRQANSPQGLVTEAHDIRAPAERAAAAEPLSNARPVTCIGGMTVDTGQTHTRQKDIPPDMATDDVHADFLETIRARWAMQRMEDLAETQTGNRRHGSSLGVATVVETELTGPTYNTTGTGGWASRPYTSPSFRMQTALAHASLRGRSMESELSTVSNRRRMIKHEARDMKRQMQQEERKLRLDQANEARAAYGPSTFDFREEKRKKANLASINQMTNEALGIAFYKENVFYMVLASTLALTGNICILFYLFIPFPDADTARDSSKLKITSIFHTYYSIMGCSAALMIVALIGCYLLQKRSTRSPANFTITLAAICTITMNIALVFVLIAFVSTCIFLSSTAAEWDHWRRDDVPYAVTYMMLCVLYIMPFIKLWVLWLYYRFSSKCTDKLMPERALYWVAPYSVGFMLFMVGLLMTIHSIPRDQYPGESFQFTFPLYNFLVLPIFGVALILTSVLYILTMNTYFTYQKSLEDYEENLESVRHAGQRVTLAEGTPCIVRHLVDQPSLNGQVGKIQTVAPDANGCFDVRVENIHHSSKRWRGKSITLKCEEFQMVQPGLSHEEFNRRVEAASLRFANYLDKSTKRLANLNLQLKVLLFLMSVIASAFFAITVLYFSTGGSEFIANLIFFDYYMPISMDAYENPNRLVIEHHLCVYWSQCDAENPYRPLSCGSCLIPHEAADHIISHGLFSLNQDVGLAFAALVTPAAFIGFLVGVATIAFAVKLRYCARWLWLLSSSACFAIMGIGLLPILHASIPLSEALDPATGRDFCEVQQEHPAFERLNVSSQCLAQAATIHIRGDITPTKRINMFAIIFVAVIVLVFSLVYTRRLINKLDVSNQWDRAFCTIGLTSYIVVYACKLTFALLTTVDFDTMDVFRNRNFGFNTSMVNGPGLPTTPYPLQTDNYAFDMLNISVAKFSAEMLDLTYHITAEEWLSFLFFAFDSSVGLFLAVRALWYLYFADTEDDSNVPKWMTASRYAIAVCLILPLVFTLPRTLVLGNSSDTGEVGFGFFLLYTANAFLSALTIASAVCSDIYPEVLGNQPKSLTMRMLYWSAYLLPILTLAVISFFWGQAVVHGSDRGSGSAVSHRGSGVWVIIFVLVLVALPFASLALIFESQGNGSWVEWVRWKCTALSAWLSSNGHENGTERLVNSASSVPAQEEASADEEAAGAMAHTVEPVAGECSMAPEQSTSTIRQNGNAAINSSNEEV